jgi:hypothetical protein
VNVALFFGDGDAAGRDWGGPLAGAYPLEGPQPARTGVGFAPIEGILGHSVGTLRESYTEQQLRCDDGSGMYCRSGAYERVDLEVFATVSEGVPVWQKHRASLLDGAGQVTLMPAGQCPSGGLQVTAHPPPPLADLLFQRVYTASELTRLDALGVTPPEYVITLKESE